MEAYNPEAMHGVALMLFGAFVLIVIIALAAILAGTQAAQVRRSDDGDDERAEEPARE